VCGSLQQWSWRQSRHDCKPTNVFQFPVVFQLFYSCVGQARLTTFSFIPRIFQYSNTFQLVKYNKGISRGPKISNLYQGVDLIIMNNFSHWPKFIFPLYFMLSFGTKFPFESSMNFKGFKSCGKNPINLPKIFLDIIFNTFNLD
jgi:hypothetical protein